MLAEGHENKRPPSAAYAGLCSVGLRVGVPARAPPGILGAVLETTEISGLVFLFGFSNSLVARNRISVYIA